MGYSDAFQDAGRIHPLLSANWYWDYRERLCPERVRGQNFLHEPFENPLLLGWLRTGVDVVPTTSPDPAAKTALQLNTGSTPNAPCFIQKKLQYLPGQHGILIMVSLIQVSADPADALLLQVQRTTTRRNLMVRFYRNKCEIFLSGEWKLLANHGPAYFCEWWFQPRENADGTETITAYAGTQWAGEARGYLPDGPEGNAGLVYLGQHSGANIDRVSQVAQLHIGDTQLSAEMTYASKEAYAAPFDAACAKLRVLIEDTSYGVIGNQTLRASLSLDGGSTFETLCLCHQGTYGDGAIDSSKPVSEFTAESWDAIPKGAKLLPKLVLAEGVYAALAGVELNLSSTI